MNGVRELFQGFRLIGFVHYEEKKSVTCEGIWSFLLAIDIRDLQNVVQGEAHFLF